jgi:hexosaminidase
MKTKIFLILLLCAKIAIGQQAFHAVIPKPLKLVAGSGYFQWNKNTKITCVAPQMFKEAVLELRAITLKTKLSGSKNSIVLVKDAAITAKEGYQLEVTPAKIQIRAASATGAIWAISSLKQLIGEPVLNDSFTWLKVPAVALIDQPRFAWRGMHLDVSRHFFDKAYLFKLLDRMSYYKFNKLHLHLTDDQGWRIEIKKYPELTEKGAWRTLNKHDSVCLEMAKTNPDFMLPEKHFKTIRSGKLYGGYYTQEDMRAIIAYASLKGIEIILEIDMPGHMMAATRLMPWLTSRGKTGFGKNFSEPLCPCKESTYEFAESVFTEIAALFPSKYIHLGADEVERDSWKGLPECDSLMKREGLKDLKELQSYFVRRMERFFKSKGKQLIGWDEILDGGVSPTATVMYWRSWVKDAPKIAAQQGNPLIMTPSAYCYFDYKQDGETLKKLYHFNPLGFGLNIREQQNVIGVQANIWTEYIPTERRLEYMVFPRMLALAELAWSSNKHWDGFETRLQKHIPLLDAMAVAYRIPDIEGFAENAVFVDSTYLSVKKPYVGMLVRYTTDGSDPSLHSELLPANLLVKDNVTVKIAGFNKLQRRGDVYTITYEKQDYLKPLKVAQVQQGLQFSYYPVRYNNAKAINDDNLSQTAITKTIEIPLEKTAPSFGTRHRGFFNAFETGVYEFALRSDDGAY